jgi:uncharacterized protein
MSALSIRVDDVRDKTVEISEEFPVSCFATLAAMEQSGEVTLTSPVRVELSAAREYDHIRVRGHVEGGVTLTCSRCLASYDDRLSSEFFVFYTRKKPEAAAPDEEVELSDIDLVSATYDGDEIDLAFEVEEQFITELPLKPLCSDQCRGLCSSCGADLNAGDCGCCREVPSLAFSALKKLKIPQ